MSSLSHLKPADEDKMTLSIEKITSSQSSIVVILIKIHSTVQFCFDNMNYIYTNHKIVTVMSLHNCRGKDITDWSGCCPFISSWHCSSCCIRSTWWQIWGRGKQPLKSQSLFVSSPIHDLMSTCLIMIRKQECVVLSC